MFSRLTLQFLSRGHFLSLSLFCLSGFYDRFAATEVCGGFVRRESIYPTVIIAPQKGTLDDYFVR